MGDGSNFELCSYKNLSMLTLHRLVDYTTYFPKVKKKIQKYFFFLDRPREMVYNVEQNAMLSQEVLYKEIELLFGEGGRRTFSDYSSWGVCNSDTLIQILMYDLIEDIFHISWLKNKSPKEYVRISVSTRTKKLNLLFFRNDDVEPYNRMLYSWDISQPHFGTVIALMRLKIPRLFDFWKKGNKNDKSV